MIRVAVFTLLVGLALSAPTSNETTSTEDDTLTVTKDFFPNQFKIHTAEHDIVKIIVPLNALNFNDDDEDDNNNDDDDGSDVTLFFVEADVKDGVKEYKGLSVLKHKKVKKLLETGTDAAAYNGESKTVYFGATDGLYVYNDTEKTAEKFGSVTDSIISLAKGNDSDIIYILTDKNELYEVSDAGTKKVKLDEVVGAQQIVMDYSDNLYYYNANKQVYVANVDGVKEIEGLPSNPTYIELVKAPFVIEDGVPVVINDKSYIVYANGSSEITDFSFEVKPSAYGLEATLIQYYAYNKSIYEYNILAILMGVEMDDFKKFFSDKTEEIQAIATRPITGVVN